MLRRLMLFALAVCLALSGCPKAPPATASATGFPPPGWPIKDLGLPPGAAFIDDPGDTDGPPGWLQINRAVSKGTAEENDAYLVSFGVASWFDVIKYVEPVLKKRGFLSSHSDSSFSHTYYSPDKKVILQVLKNTALPQGGWTYHVMQFKSAQTDVPDDLKPLE